MKQKIKSLLRVAYVAAGVMSCLALGVPALAQSSEISVVRDSLERIKRDLADLQRHIYKNRANSESSKKIGVEFEERQAAHSLIQITVLENEIRSLTGVIEETKHRVDKAQVRLDKLVEDVDFRLSKLEKSLMKVEKAPDEINSGGNSEKKSANTQTLNSESILRLPSVSGKNASAGSMPENKEQDDIKKTLTDINVSGNFDAILPDGDEKEQYEFALGLLREGLMIPSEMAQAEQAFKEFLIVNKEHPLTENARYWLGEAFYVRENYTDAAAEFIEGYQKSPFGGKASANLLKLGMSLIRLGRAEEACATFQELKEKFPDLSEDVKQRMEHEWQEASCE